jgi:molecular chaperone GrpE (heat shock protein)
MSILPYALGYIAGILTAIVTAIILLSLLKDNKKKTPTPIEDLSVTKKSQQEKQEVQDLAPYVPESEKEKIIKGRCQELENQLTELSSDILRAQKDKLDLEYERDTIKEEVESARAGAKYFYECVLRDTDNLLEFCEADIRNTKSGLDSAFESIRASISASISDVKREVKDKMR